MNVKLLENDFQVYHLLRVLYAGVEISKFLYAWCIYDVVESIINIVNCLMLYFYKTLYIQF